MPLINMKQIDGVFPPVQKLTTEDVHAFAGSKTA
jgi:hypothetical protein